MLTWQANDITDEDIDAIIARGEERTAKLDQMLRKVDRWSASSSSSRSHRRRQTENTLANFASDGGAAPTSLFVYEGEDYRAKQAHKSVLDNWIEPPKRERKANYDISAYYREALRIGPSKAKGRGTRPPKMPARSRFRFSLLGGFFLGF